MFAIRILSLATTLAALVVAHPGENYNEELMEHRRSFQANIERSSLGHCAETLKARGVTERNIKRRVATLETARKKRKIKKRDVDHVSNADYNKTEYGYLQSTSPDTLFSGNRSCILMPELPTGPLYVSGETIRKGLKEDQAGVDLLLDYQIINVDTCEPVSLLYIDVWHCNSTGVYAGVVSPGNGDINDTSNLGKTWGRGIQPTDGDGVAQFETIFPGHYTGRATHIHILVHAIATVYENATLGNEVYSSYIGQTFFEQGLIDDIERLSPYINNQQPLTRNSDDIPLKQEADAGSDPIIEWTLLGDTIEEGIFGWFSFGINVTKIVKVTPPVFRYKDGGHMNPQHSSTIPSNSTAAQPKDTGAT